MHVADTLFDSVVINCREDVTEDVFEERAVHAMEATASLDNTTLTTLKVATISDKVLQDLTEMHYSGWTKRRNSVTTNLHQCWPMRNISIRDGIIVVGDKIVIPTNARWMMLDSP